MFAWGNLPYQMLFNTDADSLNSDGQFFKWRKQQKHSKNDIAVNNVSNFTYKLQILLDN